MPDRDGDRAARPAVVRRHAPALLPQRPAARGRLHARRRRAGPSGATAMRAVRAASAPAALRRVCCRSTSPSRCSRWRCSKARCSPTTTRAAPSRSAPFRRALDFYAGIFRRGPRPGDDRQRRSRTSGTSSRAACSRSTSAGPGTSASSGAGCRASAQGDWATAPLPGPDGAGRLDRRRLEPRDLQELAAQGRGVAAGRVPQRAGDDAALSRADRQPAAAPQRLARARARERSRRRRRSPDQLERVRAAPKIPEWERIFQEMQRTAERVVRAHPGHRRQRRRSSTRGSTRCSRSAAGCARGPGGATAAR